MMVDRDNSQARARLASTTPRRRHPVTALRLESAMLVARPLALRIRTMHSVPTRIVRRHLPMRKLPMSCPTTLAALRAATPT